MEEKGATKKEEASAAKKIVKSNHSEKDDLKNQNIYDEHQKENIQKQNKESVKSLENKNKQENSQTNNQNDSNNNNINNNIEKSKRHLRGKNEINERNYRCPDCDKCYLSGPALTTHRKTKHEYGNNGEKRNRGRSKREGQEIQYINLIIFSMMKKESLYF